MSGISTHVLDLTWGKPAVGLAVRLEVAQGEAWSR
jgi:5-hydroxyisourate hydrolase-like protein (transthyretin family)